MCAFRFVAGPEYLDHGTACLVRVGGHSGREGYSCTLEVFVVFSRWRPLSFPGQSASRHPTYQAGGRASRPVCRSQWEAWLPR